MVGVVSRGRVYGRTDIARAIALLSRVDTREHTAIVELLGLGEPQLLLQVANPLLAILELTSLIIREGRKCLRHEDVNLLVERVQKLYSGGEGRFAFHNNSFRKTLGAEPFEPKRESVSIRGIR